MKYLHATDNNHNKLKHVFDQGAKNNFSLLFSQQYCSTLPPVDYHVEVLFAVKPLPTGKGRYCSTKRPCSHAPLNIIFFKLKKINKWKYWWLQQNLVLILLIICIYKHIDWHIFMTFSTQLLEKMSLSFDLCADQSFHRILKSHPVTKHNPNHLNPF